MLLNITKPITMLLHPSITKNYSAQNVSIATVEKL